MANESRELSPEELNDVSAAGDTPTLTLAQSQDERDKLYQTLSDYEKNNDDTSNTIIQNLK